MGTGSEVDVPVGTPPRKGDVWPSVLRPVDGVCAKAGEAAVAEAAFYHRMPAVADLENTFIAHVRPAPAVEPRGFVNSTAYPFAA